LASKVGFQTNQIPCGIGFAFRAIFVLSLYMFNSRIVIVLLVLLKFHNYEGCGPDKTGSQSPPGYDLNDPVKIKMPVALDEISGIFYYPKDSSVFA
jgi:hypothetical protein